MVFVMQGLRVEAVRQQIADQVSSAEDIRDATAFAPIASETTPSCLVFLRAHTYAGPGVVLHQPRTPTEPVRRCGPWSMGPLAPPLVPRAASDDDHRHHHRH